MRDKKLQLYKLVTDRRLGKVAHQIQIFDLSNFNVRLASDFQAAKKPFIRLSAYCNKIILRVCENDGARNV